MSTSKVVTGLVVAFVIFFIMTQPTSAANIFHGTWHLAVNVAHGLGNFVSKLSS